MNFGVENSQSLSVFLVQNVLMYRCIVAQKIGSSTHFSKISRKFWVQPMRIHDTMRLMKKNLLNAGFVELVDFMGDELSIVNSARVSFAKRSSRLSEADEGLIRYLYTNRHATPFEHVTLTFYVKAPIFVTREWQRHRSASYNEMSLRYHVPDGLEFWIPEGDEWRTQVGKPGAYSFEPFENEAFAGMCGQQMKALYENISQFYYQMVESGVAKEVARTVLPVSVYTEFFVTVNLRNLLGFLSLRNDKHALREIRVYAEAIEEMVSEKFPVTYKAFLSSGRVGI